MSEDNSTYMGLIDSDLDQVVNYLIDLPDAMKSQILTSLLSNPIYKSLNCEYSKEHIGLYRKDDNNKFIKIGEVYDNQLGI